ncbi:cation-translocating P-type ATPase, partial [bacterium]|nr:cation-translocating P-type ATPase [bacterium]
VMIWILAAAAIVSGIGLDEWIDAGVIVAIVLLNAILGFVQEARAETALARLEEMSALEAVVLRDGVQQRVAGADIVPGDVLVIAAGDRIAADARVISAAHLEVEESALTGESFAARKWPDSAASGSSLGDRHSMLFSGTSIASGRGVAIVVETGASTEMGRIADVLAQEEPDSPLTIELDRVGKRLALLAIGTAGLVFLAGVLRGNPIEAMILTAVALAVAAIPEGLPAVVTITLSGGVQRMAERNAIVRRLPAVEALGSASVICTDKTGTLTRNEIRVQQVVLDRLEGHPGALDPSDPRVAAFISVAALCNDASVADDGSAIGDPTESALLIALSDMAVDPGPIRAESPRLDEIAFDSRRKRMSTIHAFGEAEVVMVKGAPEEVLARCDRIETEHGPAAIGLAPDEVLEQAAQLARSGLRTLAFAYRLGSDMVDADQDVIEAGLVFAGLTGMSDEIREAAAPSVVEARRAGIAVVMVTGDHEVTARAVAREVGILDESGKVMRGEHLREMSVDDLVTDVHRYQVYSRIDPLDKVKIVEAWRSRGEITSMTGDGVNDAPALRSADVGVAMGSGTDVAKDASSIVLADDDFASIVAAVKEGRGIFTNLKTVVYYLLSCNASEVLTMFVGFLAFGALGDPLLAVQLLCINLVTDGLPALALGIDPPPPGIMDRPPDKSRDILSVRRQLALLRHGAILASATLGALVIGWYVMGLEWPVVRTMVFTTLVTVQLAHAYSIRARSGRLRDGPGRNRMLVISVLGSFALHLLVLYTPVGRSLFDVAWLPLSTWPVIASLTAASFFSVMFLNRWAARSAGV